MTSVHQPSSAHLTRCRSLRVLGLIVSPAISGTSSMLGVEEWSWSNSEPTSDVCPYGVSEVPATRLP